MNGLFDPGAWNLALLVGGVVLAILWGTARAHRGRPPVVRDLEPLERLPEAVAAAASEDRPVLFVPGSRDLDNMQTVAALSLLAEVARQSARRGVRMIVPTNRSLVMDSAREVCRRVWEEEGRGDSWRDDWVSYVSDDPLGYVARVEGLIARERPGAAFLFGSFSSESLLLAEGGYQIGSMQIAGTASPVQLPFLVPACDSTLVGEEFFSAGAALGGDRTLLGSVWGQDACKYGAIILLIGGALVATWAARADWAPVEAMARALDAFLRGGG